MKKCRFLFMILTLSICLQIVPLAENNPAVVLSSQNLVVDGNNVNCEKYNIDGNNYFKLRDIAYILTGTGSEFSVGYDSVKNAVTIITGESYTENGSELDTSNGDKSSTAVISSQIIIIDGQEKSGLSVFNIGGNNYFKLRDLGTALNFTVDYDSETNSATVQSEEKCEHKFGAWEVKTEATCTEDGLEYCTCSKCGKVVTRAIDAIGHRWKNASCTEPKTCEVCGFTEGEAIGHQWNEATCTTPKTCKICGMTEGSALGHLSDNNGYCSRCQRYATVVSTVYNDLPVEIAQYSKWNGRVVAAIKIYSATLNARSDRTTLICSYEVTAGTDNSGGKYVGYAFIYDSRGNLVENCELYTYKSLGTFEKYGFFLRDSKHQEIVLSPGKYTIRFTDYN